MKKLFIVILFWSIPFLAHTQKSDTVIKVSAQAIHIDPTPMFKALVSLGIYYSSLPSEIVTLDALKVQYKNALKAKGINWNDLKENPNDFGYETMGYDKEGTIFEYKTTSVSNMKKFLETNSLGVQRLTSVSTIIIDSEEAKLLSKIALKKAKERATVIANAMGKSLGEIQEVEDMNNRWGEEVEASLYYDQPAAQFRYIINVIFKVN